MSDLIEQLKDCCLGDQIQEIPVSFLEDLLDEIKRLTALTEADAKEIGSYREGTGLRGEIKNKDAENERLLAALENIAALDYTSAATTGACALAVRIAKAALEAAKENDV
jgi:aspartate/tyrosine/aromatic aminotransferase